MQSVPTDSRYVPFTQQAYCCVPTCFQMIMYKSGISLIPAEEIGYHLGLVVPPEDADRFYNVRVSTEKPAAGYGTRIYLPEFQPNEAFKKLGVPLAVTLQLIPNFNSASELLKELQKVEANDANALLCFNQGALENNPEKDWGHVVVFDRIVDGQLRVVDPSPTHSKWRNIDVETMFHAMKQHGESRSGGVWLVDKT